MLIFCLSLGFVYVFLLCVFALKWDKSAFFEHKSPVDLEFSVLIPFRNESQNLPIIFHSIEMLKERGLEILWIDDQSEDASLAVLKELIANSQSGQFHKLIRSTGEGKKAAIACGVATASGQLIFTTDADCILPSTWITDMSKPFSNQEIQFVAGVVMTDSNKTLFQRFQQIEWASILLITKLAFDNQTPLMCSGANLAYRKNAFIEVNGYEGNSHILSGDDEFLLKKIKNHYGGGALEYSNKTESMVLTQPLETWGGLISQRIRWSSKWKLHSFVHLVSSMVPAFLQLFWVFSFVLPFVYGMTGLMVLLLLWFLKIASEYFALRKVTKRYLLDLHMTDFFVTSIIHPIYVIVVAIGGFKGKFEWKGRSVE